MCFFPKKNCYIKSTAYKKGLFQFNCGYCPECLSSRSSHWALRSVAQARESKKACMVTLTYDTFKYDDKGNIIGENLNLRNVAKRDCQLFIKRLREYFKRKKNVDNIKYRIDAEYGKRTGRPHYHALLFGVEFDDLIFHKKSKRGNSIYLSKTLTKLWKNGICTVDSVKLTASCAKYCTKYAMKNYGASDTFSLVSHNLGINELLRTFNGLSYWLDGQEYPIPRAVWNKFIVNKYHCESFGVTYKYVNMPKQETEYKFSLRSFVAPADVPIVSRGISPIKKGFLQNTVGYKEKFFDYRVNKIAREKFRFIRDNDLQYKAYLEYWRGKAVQRQEVPTIQKINLLEDKKFMQYKNKARQADTYNRKAENYVVPRKKRKFVFACVSPIELYQVHKYEEWRRSHLPVLSRHIRANDRKKRKGKWIVFGNGDICDNSAENLPVFSPVSVQLSLF